ncbi:MAG: ribosome hibernation-promoting factor, HPF/YfiA family [bacterium]
MHVSVRGKNIEVTNALRDYVEKKVGRLQKYLENLQEAQVMLSVVKGRHIIEVTMPLNGMLLRGEEESEDMYASVDQVIEKLEKQIEKYKTRISRKSRLNGKIGAAGGDDGLREEDDRRVVKSKRFTIKPMRTDEAIMQMDLLGHDFFVYINSETDDTNVVYRRRDGHYGQIEPESK